jgi:predicted ATPase
MIYELEISESTEWVFNFCRPGPEQRILGPLAKVNLIVGPNNSGKSRLLRATTSCANGGGYTVNKEAVTLWHKTFELEVQSDNESLQAQADLESAKDFYSTRPVPNTRSSKSNIEQTRFFFESYDFFDADDYSFTEHFRELKLAIDRARSETSNADTRETIEFSYIPTLRGFRAPDEEKWTKSKTCYFDDRTTSDYGYSLNKAKIFSGGTMNMEFKQLLLGNLEERNLAMRYQNFLGDEFFDGEEIILLPKLENEILHLKVGKEKEQPIHSVGDGLQHLITITFQAFRLKYNSDAVKHKILLIEEPELFLHPGIQRRLLNSFISGGLAGIQVIATTQSNHLIQCAMESPEVAIFQIRKKVAHSQNDQVLPEFDITHHSLPDRDIINYLGVNNASVLLANCIILVEGIWDLLYLEKLLSVYWNVNDRDSIWQRDIHYAFMFYSGANIAHFDFCRGPFKSESIFGNFLCIADQDDEKKRSKRFNQIRSILGSRFFVLPCKEIENLLSASTIGKVVADYLNNDACLDSFCYSEYKNQYLGAYIDGKLAELRVKSKGAKKSFSSESGTIKGKQSFCNKALRFIDSMEGFSEDAPSIAKAIDDHIKKYNS